MKGFIAVAMWLWPALAGAEPVRLWDLLGTDKETVFAAASPRREPSLTLDDPRGVLEFYEMEPHSVISSENHRPGRICRTVFGGPALAEENSARDDWSDLRRVEAEHGDPASTGPVLMFRSGTFEAALLRVAPVRVGNGTRIIADVPLVSRPGGLPLEDGATFLGRRPDLRLPADTVVNRLCAPRPQFRNPFEGQVDGAGRLQGMALSTLAWRLPGLNAQRERARRAGEAAWAALRLGERLPGGVRGFMRTTPYVRAYKDNDPAYVVLSLDLGDLQSRNLARMNVTALIGMRDGRVAWLYRSDRGSGLGVIAARCSDRRGRLGAARRGCSPQGIFRP